MEDFEVFLPLVVGVSAGLETDFPNTDVDVTLLDSIFTVTSPGDSSESIVLVLSLDLPSLCTKKETLYYTHS